MIMVRLEHEIVVMDRGGNEDMKFYAIWLGDVLEIWFI